MVNIFHNISDQCWHHINTKFEISVALFFAKFQRFRKVLAKNFDVQESTLISGDIFNVYSLPILVSLFAAAISQPESIFIQRNANQGSCQRQIFTFFPHPQLCSGKLTPDVSMIFRYKYFYFYLINDISVWIFIFSSLKTATNQWGKWKRTSMGLGFDRKYCRSSTSRGEKTLNQWHYRLLNWATTSLQNHLKIQTDRFPKIWISKIDDHSSTYFVNVQLVVLSPNVGFII